MTDNSKPAPRLLSSHMPGADYGVFLRAVPVSAAFALLVVALVTHSIVYTVLLLLLAVSVSGLLAAAEIFHAPITWKTDSPLRPMLRWFGLVALVWPYGYPAYLRARKRFGFDDWLPAALVVEAVLLAGAVTAGIIIGTGYGKAAPQAAVKAEQQLALFKADPHWMPDKDDIEIVQSGYLNTCMHKTVKQMVDGYFASPHWESGATSDGTDFVNTSGIVTYQGKSVPAVFQFVMDKDKRGFRYHGFEIDGVPQTLFIAAFTLAQMCAED
ncbi:MAG: hypothetical protein ACRESC_07495 [Gammaproteobacteria bacterium]